MSKTCNQIAVFMRKDQRCLPKEQVQLKANETEYLKQIENVSRRSNVYLVLQFKQKSPFMNRKLDDFVEIVLIV